MNDSRNDSFLFFDFSVPLTKLYVNGDNMLPPDVVESTQPDIEDIEFQTQVNARSKRALSDQFRFIDQIHQRVLDSLHKQMPESMDIFNPTGGIFDSLKMGSSILKPNGLLGALRGEFPPLRHMVRPQSKNIFGDNFPFGAPNWGPFQRPQYESKPITPITPTTPITSIAEPKQIDSVKRTTTSKVQLENYLDVSSVLSNYMAGPDLCLNFEPNSIRRWFTLEK